MDTFTKFCDNYFAAVSQTKYEIMRTRRQYTDQERRLAQHYIAARQKLPMRQQNQLMEYVCKRVEKEHGSLNSEMMKTLAILTPSQFEWSLQQMKQHPEWTLAAEDELRRQYANAKEENNG